MSLLAVITLLEGPSTEVKQKHKIFSEVGDHLFIDADILCEKMEITKTEYSRGLSLFCQQT
jgi:hypothetical protein